jgi:general secretion pathway protein G
VRKRKGFTMVELLVVILIMAVLGLSIVPSLIGSADKSKYARAWSDLNGISNAFVGLYGRKGTIPQFTVTGTDITSIKDEGATDLQSFLGTPIDQLKDPWGKPYQIKSTWDGATGKGCIIVYVKPDGDGKDANFGSGEKTVSARKDPYNEDAPMAKLVIDIPSGGTAP